MSESTYEGWAIVEIMGYRQRPGYIREVEMAGTKMLRVDIPSEDGDITEYYGGSSIYSVRPVTEPVARDAAKLLNLRPVKPVDYREPPQLTGPSYEAEEIGDDLPI